MKVNWIIDGYMLERAEEASLPSFADAVSRAGHDLHVTRWETFTKDVSSLPHWDDECVMAYGSFRFVRQLDRMRRSAGHPPWEPGTFAKVDALSYSSFGAHLGDLLLNDDFVILPFAEFRRRGMSPWGDAVFLRPDAVTKGFAGLVVPAGDFDIEMNGIEKLGAFEPEQLVVAASVKPILRETRFVVCQGKVVTGSTYGWNGSGDVGLPIDDESVALAQDVASRRWQADVAYTCDVAITEIDGRTQARLLELNSFSCAGLYACDLDKVVEAVSAAAWATWEDLR